MIAYQKIIVFLVILPLFQHRSAYAANFLLVHGSCHGAWCWYKLATLLEEAGHNVTAIDLAYSGRNQIPLEAVHTIDDYHKPLYSHLERLSPKDRVVLVGHSYGGLAVSSAMERFPERIAAGVFVTAYMLGPNLTLAQVTDMFPLRADSIKDSIIIGDSPRILLFGPRDLATLYKNSPQEDYKLANYSIRVTQLFNDEVSKKQLMVSKERYGSIPRAYIIAESDETDMQRFFIESDPPDVVHEIAGADHMVMFSKPQDLANSLQKIARDSVSSAKYFYCNYF